MKMGLSIAVYFAGNCELLSQCYPEKLLMPPVQKMQRMKKLILFEDLHSCGMQEIDFSSLVCESVHQR